MVKSDKATPGERVFQRTYEFIEAILDLRSHEQTPIPLDRLQFKK